MAKYRLGNQVGELDAYVHEAVERFGYIKPEKAADLIGWMADQNAKEMDGHGEVLRREGRELSEEEKRALGLRPSFRLTHEALDFLTEAGREDPKRAFNITIQRATAGIVRDLKTANSISVVTESPNLFEGLRISTFHGACPAAKALEGKTFNVGSLPSLPFCDQEACHCSFISSSLIRRSREAERNRPSETAWAMKALPDETPAPKPKRSWLARLLGR